LAVFVWRLGESFLENGVYCFFWLVHGFIVSFFGLIRLFAPHRV
jgi:hypothetical protein